MHMIRHDHPGMQLHRRRLLPRVTESIQHILDATRDIVFPEECRTGSGFVQDAVHGNELFARVELFRKPALWWQASVEPKGDECRGADLIKMREPALGDLHTVLVGWSAGRSQITWVNVRGHQ